MKGTSKGWHGTGNNSRVIPKEESTRGSEESESGQSFLNVLGMLLGVRDGRGGIVGGLGEELMHRCGGVVGWVGGIQKGTGGVGEM